MTGCNLKQPVINTSINSSHPFSNAGSVLAHGTKCFTYVISLNPRDYCEVSLTVALLHLSTLRHG